jgi:hypothetical protein
MLPLGVEACRTTDLSREDHVVCRRTSGRRDSSDVTRQRSPRTRARHLRRPLIGYSTSPRERRPPPPPPPPHAPPYPERDEARRVSRRNAPSEGWSVPLRQRYDVLAVSGEQKPPRGQSLRAPGRLRPGRRFAACENVELVRPGREDPVRTRARRCPTYSLCVDVRDDIRDLVCSTLPRRSRSCCQDAP